MGIETKYTCVQCQFYQELTSLEHGDVIAMLKEQPEATKGEYGICHLHGFSPGAAMWTLTPATHPACMSVMIQD